MAEKKVTWERINGEQKSAIDYILVSKEARMRSQAVTIDEQKEIDVNSDHNVMILKYKMKEERKQKEVEGSRNKEVKWKRRNADWEKFREQLNKCNQLKGKNKKETNENIQKHLRNVGEKTIGYEKRRNEGVYRPWWNDQIKKARRERKQANKKRREMEKRRERGENIEDHEIAGEIQKYKNKQEEVKREIKEAMIKEEIRELQEIKNSRDEKKWWKYIKGPGVRTRGDKTTELKIRNEITRDKNKIEEHIKEYWEEIGRKRENRGIQEIVIKQSRIEEEQKYEIKKKEIEEYVKKLKNEKAVGPDGIPNEFYKEGGEKIIG